MSIYSCHNRRISNYFLVTNWLNPFFTVRDYSNLANEIEASSLNCIWFYGSRFIAIINHLTYWLIFLPSPQERNSKLHLCLFRKLHAHSKDLLSGALCCCRSIPRKPAFAISHYHITVTLHLVMHAPLHKHVLRCVCIQQQSLIELIMGPSSVPAINQPASRNTEAGFTVNVYTAGPSITSQAGVHTCLCAQKWGLRAHTSSKARHAINHTYLTLAGKLPSHMQAWVTTSLIERMLVSFHSLHSSDCVRSLGD